MSDPKRASLITAGAPKSAKNNVNKTLRLSINLDVSDETKYPELNYKELYAAALKKKRGENCKTSGLDPFSDNDDDIKRATRKFEQKYGGKSTYGKKGRSKYDDFADIGAGYDENDSFIDNTDGYDEIMPPECDTEYGGFYINSGDLEFKTVPENNKRGLSSSSSEEESSASSSDSDSQEAKDTKVITNGNVDSHKTEHRKKKNKTIDKQKAKKIRRTDSSAATSGKQTSDENAPADGSTGDSRSSASDSLTSKPAPSSENNATSDSSRDAETKEIKLPASVNQILEELETLSRFKEYLGKDDSKTEACIVRLDKALKEVVDNRLCEHAWSRAAKTLGVGPDVITHRAREREKLDSVPVQNSQPQPIAGTKRKLDELLDTSTMTPEEKEANIEDVLQRLKTLIKEREPGMMATYKAECERVEEERKKLSIGSVSGGSTGSERRRPKRRFPWCARARALLARLAALGGAPEHPAAAAALLTQRAFPLFPDGFVRLPTLLKQADLNKDIKVSDLKKQRVSSISSQAAPQSQPSHATQPVQPMMTSTQFTEPIQFPSSLTVTTSVKSIDRSEDDKYKVNPAIGALINSYTLNKDLVIEKPEDRKTDRSKEEYIPANSIGSITITPVVAKDKKADKAKEPLLRVKSPAALNEMIHKKDKPKKPEKNVTLYRDKRLESPLHVDISGNTKKDSQSPKLKEEISQKVIENMRSVENNIPRPALISVHHSPTFVKPDKRPPEVKKKKEPLIISDEDPLSDVRETNELDDNSDVVFMGEVRDKCENSDVPSDVKSDKCEDLTDETANEVMKNLREMAHSQEPASQNSSSYGGVITSGKMSSKSTGRAESRSNLESFFEDGGWADSDTKESYDDSPVVVRCRGRLTL
ncbi:hypothetical protein KGM_207398 [Danaus plexippus plexippus]|uniref:Ubinuclein-1 n=1 Tax=Danaus plexippus plexippus TaxID=278856 RepID=A0A212ES69_DANPL|nr:hypothetical protein KGM_207398 [Danaus plexippus plexippus]